MLRDIEKEVLENGTYIRFCLCLEENADTKKLAKDILSIKNIKYAEAINSKVMIFILYVDDPYSPPICSDKVDKKGRKHNKQVQHAYYAMEKKFNDFMENNSIVDYCVFFTTTNFGSFITGLSGRIERKPNYKKERGEFIPYSKKDVCNITDLKNINSDYLMYEAEKHDWYTFHFLVHVWRHVALSADEISSSKPVRMVIGMPPDFLETVNKQ